MRRFILGLSLCLILGSGWLALTAGVVEPIEYNIVYVHAPASICSLVCFAVVFICSIQYLRTGRAVWDCSCAASAEAGLVFAIVSNVTGMLFSRAVWGVWWTPSMRLISSAVLLFLYIAYLILRNSFSSERRRGRVCAVFGIAAFADVPFLFISARFIRDIHQPGISFEGGWQSTAFGMAVLGALLLMCVLIWLRSDVLRAKAEAEVY